MWLRNEKYGTDCKWFCFCLGLVEKYEVINVGTLHKRDVMTQSNLQRIFSTFCHSQTYVTRAPVIYNLNFVKADVVDFLLFEHTKQNDTHTRKSIQFANFKAEEEEITKR